MAGVATSEDLQDISMETSSIVGVQVHDLGIRNISEVVKALKISRRAYVVAEIVQDRMHPI